MGLSVGEFARGKGRKGGGDKGCPRNRPDACDNCCDWCDDERSACDEYCNKCDECNESGHECNGCNGCDDECDMYDDGHGD